MLIGLTGIRHSGKTSIADILVEQHGFVRVHAFAPGKEMLMGYYTHLGIPRSLAKDMLHGFLKDTPFKDIFFRVQDDEILGRMISIGIGGSKVKDMGMECVADYLPGRDCREHMEKLGYFMGVEMGADYTLGAELKRIWRENPDANVVAESVVYEAEPFFANGGILVNVVRDCERPEGEKTDQGVEDLLASGVPYLNFENNGEFSKLPEAVALFKRELECHLKRND